MTGTVLLDAAIGVIFVILSFSLVASALQEALAGVLNWRGRMLRRGLFRLLEGTAGAELADLPWLSRERIRRAELTLEVLSDPSIRVLHGPRSLASRLWDRLVDLRRTDIERAAAKLGRLPSAIPADSFARALVDSLARRIDLSAVRPEDGLTAENAEAAAAALRRLAVDLADEADRALRAADGVLAAMPLDPILRGRLRQAVGRLSVAREVEARLGRTGRAGAELRASLDALMAEAETAMRGALDQVGGWFDRAMERVSDWYARRTRLTLFVLGLILAAVANVDLSQFGGRVLADGDLRGALVTRAGETVDAGMPPARPGRAAGSAEDALDEVTAVVRRADGALAALPGHDGPGFGRACLPHETWGACVRRTMQPGAVVSWVIIALGCMMGGQFWYDLLGALLRFRPAPAARRQA